MNESLYLNKVCFLNQFEEHSLLICFMSLIVSIAFILICNFEIQLSVPIKGIYQSDTKSIKFIADLESIEKIVNCQNIKLDNLKYPFEIKNISEILLDETHQTNYQIIEIKSPKDFRENQVVQIQLLDKKDKIIKKIVKMIGE